MKSSDINALGMTIALLVFILLVIMACIGCNSETFQEWFTSEKSEKILLPPNKYDIIFEKWYYKTNKHLPRNEAKKLFKENINRILDIPKLSSVHTISKDILNHLP